MQTKQSSLIFFFIGLLVLFFLSQILEPQEIKIDKITRKNLDEKVKITGSIQSIIEKSNITILTINDSTGAIQGIIYEKLNLSILNSNKSELYEFQGKISEYNNNLEIEIEKIKEIL